MLSNSPNSSPSSSSIEPTNSSAGPAGRTFVTKRLPFAVFLHASGKLKFLGLEPDANRTNVHFIFADPDGISDDLELSFEAGECVSAAAIFASQKFLRKKMTAVLGGGLRWERRT